MRNLSLPLLVLVTACSQSPAPSSTKVRSLTRAEAQADFEQIVQGVRTYYGPLEYKERRFGYTLTEIADEGRAEIAAVPADAGDNDYFAVFQRFLAKLEDGHVGISFPLTGSPVEAFNIPIFLQEIEGQAVVGTAQGAASAAGIVPGDVILSVDGKKTMDYLATIKKYDALGQDATEDQFIFRVFYRPATMREIVPTSETASIVVQHADGTSTTVELPWTIALNDTIVNDGLAASFSVGKAQEFNRAAGMSVAQWGDSTPFFATDAVKAKFAWTEVQASEEMMAKYGAKSTAADWPVFAATYEWQGKKVLLVREPSYAGNEDAANANFIKNYKAVLDQYEAWADVLVVDQTHNTGGIFCQEFFRLFADKSYPAFVQFNNADRDWVTGLDSEWPKLLGEMITDADDSFYTSLKAIGTATEQAYDARKSITSDALPLLGGFNKTGPYQDYHWKKPFLVLADELAGSCGDIFPMLIKASGVAKIMGQRTVGLGGNVSQVSVLGNSLAQVRLTRGLYTTYQADGTYTDEDLMENHGVLPDIEYDHTIADFRAGYVGYVGAFSDEAVKLLK